VFRGWVVLRTLTTRRLLALTVVLSACAAGAGCSLVNSFGDVVPAADAAPGEGGGAESGSGDSSIDQTTGDGSPSLESGSDSAVDGTAGSEGGDATGDGPGALQDGGAGDGSEAGPTVQAGAVVVGGVQMGDGGFVLSVLDPTTGLELSRQGMTVVGVRHDPVRDLWYVFEDDGGIGAPSVIPTDNVHLHVYTMATSSGTWSQQASIKVPPLVSADAVAVLNGRLAYTAYALNDAGTATGGYDLVVIDTSTQTSPQVMSPPTALADYPVGTIGTYKTSGLGGSINLFHVDMTMCQGDAGSQLCELEAVHVTVPASGAPVVSGTPVGIAAVDPTQSQGFASYVGGGPEDTIAFAPANGGSAYVQLFSTATSIPIAGSVAAFGIADPHLQNIAIAECFGLAFVVGVPNDTQLFGVPIAAGTNATRTVDLGHSGQAVAFEPYTSTVIAPFKASGSFAISAYKLGGTAATPTLTNRTTGGTWQPPADLEPNFVAVRNSIPFKSCPP
jgi:hypothetical protein